MGQPWTLQFGPWAPDLQNVAVQIPYQWGATPVPCADVLNVYYADGTYRSLPGTTLVANLADTPLNAFTGLDSSGSPVRYAGSANQLYAYQSGAWAAIGAGGFAATQWAFAQFANSMYAMPASNTVPAFIYTLAIDDVGVSSAGVINFTGSVTSNVLTVTAIASGPAFQVGMTISAPGVTAGTAIQSLGTGTGGTGTYNLSATPNQASEAMFANVPPVGNVLATVGQFLFVGDVSAQFANTYLGNNAFSLGTGDGATLTFTATIPNIGVRSNSVAILNAGVTVATDNGSGVISGSGVTGTINYGTGAMSVTFTVAPLNGNALAVNYIQAFPNRVQWCAINNPGFWPTPLTNAALAVQSSYQDMEGALGPIMAVSGYPLYAVIFQRFGISRASYVGGNIVFQFGTYDRKRGLVARGAWVQVGAISYFLADQGFFATDGANVYPIGTDAENDAGIDRWFWTNVNKNALSAISAGWDATLRCVVFAIPTGTNTVPDTLLVFNPMSQRWTKASVSTELVWPDSDGTRGRLGVFAQPSGGNSAYQVLTGTPATGYLESCDFMFTDGMTRYATGARPNVNCTDTPTVVIGNRNTLAASVSYANAAVPDPFGGGFAPVLTQGLYTRTRVTSANASAIHGATLMLESGGPI